MALSKSQSWFFRQWRLKSWWKAFIHQHALYVSSCASKEAKKRLAATSNKRISPLLPETRATLALDSKESTQFNGPSMKRALAENEYFVIISPFFWIPRAANSIFRDAQSTFPSEVKQTSFILSEWPPVKTPTEFGISCTKAVRTCVGNAPHPQSSIFTSCKTKTFPFGCQQKAEISPGPSSEMHRENAWLIGFRWSNNQNLSIQRSKSCKFRIMRKFCGYDRIWTNSFRRLQSVFSIRNAPHVSTIISITGNGQLQPHQGNKQNFCVQRILEWNHHQIVVDPSRNLVDLLSDLHREPHWESSDFCIEAKERLQRTD